MCACVSLQSLEQFTSGSASDQATLAAVHVSGESDAPIMSTIPLQPQPSKDKQYGHGDETLEIYREARVSAGLQLTKQMVLKSTPENEGRRW